MKIERSFKWNEKNIKRSVYFPEVHTFASSNYSLKEIIKDRIDITHSDIATAILMIFEEIENMNSLNEGNIKNEN